MTSRAVVQLSQPDLSDLVAVPPSLRLLGSVQLGVVTRQQLARAGWDAQDVETATRSRRWRTVGRHVVVLQNAPLTPTQREWVAVLLPGKPAALAGLSAAAAAGLRGFEPDRVHIVVRHATEVRLPAWVQVHESRRFTENDILTGAGTPRTAAPRSVVDGATWSRYPRRACAILCAGVQQRVATPEQLADELAVAGRIRHVAIMRQILGDIAGGGHTLAEIDLGRLATRAGLLPPRRQVLRKDPAGRVRYLDAEFDLPDGQLLVVEVDGRGHMEIEQWIDDADRDNEVVIGGRTVLRYPSLTIRLHGRRVIDQLCRIRLAHAA